MQERGHRVWELYFKGSKSGAVILAGEGDTGSVFKKIAWLSILPLAAMFS